MSIRRPEDSSSGPGLTPIDSSSPSSPTDRRISQTVPQDAFQRRRMKTTRRESRKTLTKARRLGRNRSSLN
jgi:hypothetical protein